MSDMKANGKVGKRENGHKLAHSAPVSPMLHSNGPEDIERLGSSHSSSSGSMAAEDYSSATTASSAEGVLLTAGVDEILVTPTSATAMRNISSRGQLHLGNIVELEPLPPKMTEVHFKVICETVIGEEVFVTGNSQILGKWKAEDGVKLSTDATTYPVWEGTAELPVGTKLEYKYYVVFIGGKKRELKRWESCSNHKVNVVGYECHIDDGVFGNGSEHDAVWTDKGWLSNDHQLTLRLGSWNDDTQAVKMMMPTEQGFWLSFVPVESEESVTVRYLEQNGLVLVNGNQLELLGLYIDVYICGTNDRVGRAVLPASDILSLRSSSRHKSSELIVRPFLNESLVHVGEFRAECSICSPFTHIDNHFGNVFRKQWSNVGAVDIGHRGMGNSRTHNGTTKRAIVTENTVLSFQLAAKSGADYIEFDVQLTKDKVPVLYHDFNLGINLGKDGTRKKKSRKTRILEMGVQQLSLSEMKTLHMNMQPEFDSAFTKRFNKVVEKKAKMGRTLSSNDFHDLKSSKTNMEEGSTAKPHWAIKAEVATLMEVFEQVPEWLGFNIEVKYPMLEEMGDNLLYFERNEYLDAILQVVFDCAKSRRILFSSFDPDICYMLTLKQPRYPVFLLTEGGMEQYRDYRCSSLEAAMEWAVTAHLRGIVSDSRPVVENPEIVSKIKSKGLLIFTYGFQNENTELRDLQKKFGVDGLITDHVRKLTRSEQKSHSVFEALHNQAIAEEIEQREHRNSDGDYVIEGVNETSAMVGN